MVLLELCNWIKLDIWLLFSSKLGKFIDWLGIETLLAGWVLVIVDPVGC